MLIKSFIGVNVTPPWVWDTGYRNKLQYYVNHLPMADVVCVCVCGGGGLPQNIGSGCLTLVIGQN